MTKRKAGDHITRETVCGNCKHAKPHPDEGRPGKLLCGYQSQHVSVDPASYCMVTLMGFERKSG